jgi:nitrate/nitrite-specific signal transduction histidine kinase
MKETEQERGGYVRKVREETQRYTHDLLAENERLRVQVASLKGERLHLTRRLAEALEERASRERNEHHLETRLAAAEQESRRYSERYVEIEQQNSDLANLYVASYRLHGTMERQEVLDVIQEIVSALVGSEEMAVFEMDPDDSRLRLVTSTGIEAERFRAVSMGSGLIGTVARTGEAYVADGEGPDGGRPEEVELTACFPLKLDGRVTGAIALFRLLPQKPGLQPLDMELFDLLGTHAATALYATGLHARMRETAVRSR